MTKQDGGHGITWKMATCYGLKTMILIMHQNSRFCVSYTFNKRPLNNVYFFFLLTKYFHLFYIPTSVSPILLSPLPASLCPYPFLPCSVQALLTPIEMYFLKKAPIFLCSH